MRLDIMLHPTDFSYTANHALGVAVDLASRHGAAQSEVEGRAAPLGRDVPV